VHAVVIDEGQLTIRERPTPQPGGRDVLVAVRGAGLNAADLLQRAGLYPAPPGWPSDIPGLELAGVVVATGEDADESLVGRRVCAIVGAGAQATHCVVPEEHLLAVPDHASWDEAAGFAEAFVTAHDALTTQARVTAGDHVLVSGANGGVGVAAVQVARALGARVTAVARSSARHEALRELGADRVVTLEEVTELDPVDVLIELVGAQHLALAQRVLAPASRVVVIGVGAGSRVELDLLAMMNRRSTFTGSTLRSRSREEKSLVIARVRDALVPKWNAKEIRVPVAATFELAQVGAAYDYFAQSGKLGKVVLRVAT
jgi:NADPH:quinone reductase